MGGSDTQPAQTTQVSQIQLPAWVEQASQQNYNLAKQISDRPLEQYQGPMVAGQSGMTTDAYNYIKQLFNMPTGITDIGTMGATDITDATSPLYQQAMGLLNKAGSPLDISSYLNPYTNEVEQRAIGNANTALDQQLRGVSDSARKAGAFGGSRQAIEAGVTRGEGIRNIGDLTAQLRQAGFNTATANALADRSGMRDTAQGILSTAQGVQGSRLANQQALINQQQQQMAKFGQSQDTMLQNIAQLFGAGQNQQSFNQANIDAAMKKFYEARDYPIEQLNLRLAALGMSPYGRTETSTKTATSEDKGPDWSTIGLGVLKAAPALFAMSDRTTKTDIEKLGKDPDTGLDMYAYRYKNDPKTYPKIVGPMAQDIEKKHPKAVKKFGGKRVIDLNNLMEALA